MRGHSLIRTGLDLPSLISYIGSAEIPVSLRPEQLSHRNQTGRRLAAGCKKERIVMSYPDKLASAAALIAKHNETVDSTIATIPEGDATREELEKTKVNPDAFKRKLIGMGAASEAALASCKWEDIASLGIPTFLARQIAGVFRQTAEPAAPVFISDSKASRMTFEELFAHYVPGEDTAVSRKLAELARKNPVVVLTPEGQVNGPVCAKLLKEVRDGLPGREVYIIDNRPCRVYRIGERPDERFDENPLYPGRPLRPDGTCDQTSRSWENIPLRVRQIVYLARKQTGELTVTHAEAHNILDIVTGENAEVRLSQRFPKAVMALDEATHEGTAPTLKVKLNRSGAGKAFGGGEVLAHQTH